ncbi:MAG: helix-turn-helix domain-containing protein [Bacteroidota bacterium]
MLSLVEMRVIPYPLSPFLQQFIKAMWVVEEDSGIEVNVNCFPVGYPFINVISGARFRLSSALQTDVEVHSYVSGAFNQPFALHMRLINRALTIQLLPHAIPSFFGWSAHAFKNLLVPLAEVNQALSEALENEIASSQGSGEVLARCAQILEQHCQASGEVDERIPYVFRQLFLSRGAIKISDLASSTNVSMRRLQQLFKDAFGLSPKTYSRVIRMQYHTYQLLQNRGWDTVIPEGYYDQSHFLHELKKQTNMLPTEYAQHISDPSKKPAYVSSNLFYQVYHNA